MRAAAGVPEKALEGAEYAAVFARHRIPYRTRSIVTEVLGTAPPEQRVRRADSQGRRRRAGSGPALNACTRTWTWWASAGASLRRWNCPSPSGAETRLDADGSLVGVVDERQQSSVPGLFLAGEVTGVGGATLAVLEGLAAGAAAAGGRRAVGAGTPPPARHRRFAEAMHRAHPVPAGWQDWLTPATMVCRCEEVTAGQITEARESLEARDARTIKSFTRAGMGWCQGRVCGFAAACLGQGPAAPPSAESLSGAAKRPLAAPVGIGELAALEPSDN